MLTLETLVKDVADGLKEFDSTRPICTTHKHVFKAGVGPWGERGAVAGALEKMKSRHPQRYASAKLGKIDLDIPYEWIAEVKIVRPFGDNGSEAEHWSQNVLHPYPGNTSSLGDALKLVVMERHERKAILIVGYEHSPPRVPLEPVIPGFEIMADFVMGLRLSPRVEEVRANLVHEVHQQLRVFGYEVLGSGR